jgi:hypothetical protein
MTKDKDTSLLQAGAEIKESRIQFEHDSRVRHQNMVTKGRGK